MKNKKQRNLGNIIINITKKLKEKRLKRENVKEFAERETLRKREIVKKWREGVHIKRR